MEPIPTTSARERRFVATASLRLERRAEGDSEGKSPRIVGHAVAFDAWTTLYESPRYLWREVVRPGAFAAALTEGQDVRALFNHDANFILGRTKSGTLALAEDEAGLLSTIDPPDTQAIRDLVLAPIARGDVSGMSFAFTVRRGPEQVITETDTTRVVEDGGQRLTTRREGDQTIEERELLALDLYDVSPVVFPAYEQTDVALRALGERRERELFESQGGRTRRRLHRAGMRLRLLEAGLTTR